MMVYLLSEFEDVTPTNSIYYDKDQAMSLLREVIPPEDDDWYTAYADDSVVSMEVRAALGMFADGTSHKVVIEGDEHQPQVAIEAIEIQEH